MLRPVVPCVVLALLLPARPAPAQAPAELDPLAAVPDDASWVLSFDPRPFRGTALHDYVVPTLAGDPELLDHPEALNVVRLVAAGHLAELPAWRVLAASGLFVWTPSSRGSGLLAGLAASVGYAHPLGTVRPGGAGRHAVTYAHSGPPGSLYPRFVPGREDPPLVAWAREFLAPQPALWSAVRVDHPEALVSSLFPESGALLPPGVGAGVVHAFFGLRSRVSGAARLVVDFDGPEPARAFGAFLGGAVRRIALGGTPLAGVRLDTAGNRVDLAFRVDARLLRWLGEAIPASPQPRGP